MSWSMFIIVAVTTFETRWQGGGMESLPIKAVKKRICATRALPMQRIYESKISPDNNFSAGFSVQDDNKSRVRKHSLAFTPDVAFLSKCNAIQSALVFLFQSVAF